MQAQSTPARADADAPNLKALGAAVRELRARRGLSQEWLGFKAELHRNYIGAIERGQINPTLRTLMRLADGLAVPLSELVEMYERNNAEPASPM
ncbi:MAG TPA: helix-turn-helix transcriptional regulator [Conexibacter sp.]